MPQENTPQCRFDEMNLSPQVASILEEVGYDTPTPIQSGTIPHMLEGRDVLGLARTGTGKTAAYALPLLSRINVKNKAPQVLVLTPTRELAIQVAESFKAYGRNMKGLSVLPVYGGQGYAIQLKSLKQGVHVVVGTPGRLMDHMKRKTVSFEDLFCVVLDEADEMLHMGFIEDVEWILEQTPEDAQCALFSATMPAPIRKIAQTYLTEPEEIMIREKTADIGTITQRYCMAEGRNKLAALTRILGATIFDGVIVFTRTKSATLTVTAHLDAEGFKAEALNGDMAQNAREQTVNRLKKGAIDILVATDVAARGLDVERISHVINFDMPDKVEPYIHRIGRTGRAGRDGEAILFLARREKWMLRAIQKKTGQEIKEMSPPSNDAINRNRIAQFTDQLARTIADEDISDFEGVIRRFAQEEEVSPLKIAAALAKMSRGKTPFLLPADKKAPAKKKSGKTPEEAPHPQSQKASPKEKPSESPVKIPMAPPEKGMERYRIDVGRIHGLRPKDVVGAISNEAGLESQYIGHISIDQDFCLVDLPFGMPKPVFRQLKKTWLRSRRMNIRKCA